MSQKFTTKFGHCTVVLASLIFVTAGLTGEIQVFDSTVVMPNDTTVTIQLPQFDGSLGTLNSVTVTVRVDVSGANVQMDNDSTLEQSGTARVQNQINSFSTTASTLDNTFTNLDPLGLQMNTSQLFILDPTTGDTVGSFDQTGLADFANWTPGTLSAGDARAINAVVYNQYTGDGTVDFSINSTYTTSASFSGSDGYFQGNTPSGSFYAMVEYDYSPVPEVAQTATLVCLFGFIAVLVRRKKGPRSA